MNESNMKTIQEIKRQLGLKPEITSIAPPHVVVNGVELLAEIEKLINNKVEARLTKLFYTLISEKIQPIVFERYVNACVYVPKISATKTASRPHLEAYAKSLVAAVLDDGSSKLKTKPQDDDEDEDDDWA